MISWMKGLEVLEAARNSQVSPISGQSFSAINYTISGKLDKQRQEHGASQGPCSLDLAQAMMVCRTATVT
jgi:hypothetical protein